MDEILHREDLYESRRNLILSILEEKWRGIWPAQLVRFYMKPLMLNKVPAGNFQHSGLEVPGIGKDSQLKDIVTCGLVTNHTDMSQ